MPKRITTVAFIPEANSEAENYAGRTLGVRFDSIRTGSAPGVSATPTLLLVDQAGKVLKAWIGQLAAPGEEEVFKAISE